MRYPGITSRLLFDQCLQVFADSIAQEFAMPAPEALRQINDELARNAMTRGVRLDSLIGSATRDWKGPDLADALTVAGVPAAPVQDAADLLERDPQLAARGHFVRLQHPVMGESVYSGIPYRLSRTPGRLRSPAPLLGADTHDVCTRLLGLDEAGYRRLSETGAIG